MNNVFHRIMAPALLCAAFMPATGCRREPAAQSAMVARDSIQMISEIEQHRASVDAFFRTHPLSPFQQDPSSHYTGIKWFPPDLRFVFRLKLMKYHPAEEVTVYGSKGELRHQRKYGYFNVPFEEKTLRLNVYKEEEDAPPPARDHFLVWFTDGTTGNDTYGVGRYIEIGEEDPDPEHLYLLDFNAAYNPYCAYSDEYSCAVPRKEDHLDIAIRAGELKYHP
jgi:uncharacterized protein (DUF1684 family)